MSLFGQNLRRLREQRRLSRPQLSALTGVPAGTIEAYETRDVDPTVSRAIAFAEFFRVTLDDLAGRPVPVSVAHLMRRASDAALDATLERLDQELRAVRGLLGLAPPGEEDPPLEQSG